MIVITIVYQLRLFLLLVILGHHHSVTIKTFIINNKYIAYDSIYCMSLMWRQVKN